MYSPDTLQRLNQEAVDREMTEDTRCDHCDKKATMKIPVYNPADALRDPPITDPYCMVNVCEEHYDDGSYMEELFYCDSCSEYFIVNHSWNNLAVRTEDGIYCQQCFANNWEPEDENGNRLTLAALLSELRNGKTSVKTFRRLDRMPGKRLLWEGEFSQWSDFPGHTSLDSVAREINEASWSEDVKDVDSSILVYPLITFTNQFSVSLAVYY